MRPSRPQYPASDSQTLHGSARKLFQPPASHSHPGPGEPPAPASKQHQQSAAPTSYPDSLKPGPENPEPGPDAYSPLQFSHRQERIPGKHTASSSAVSNRYWASTHSP